MSALNPQEIIDSIPTHHNIHKSDIIAHCEEDGKSAQILFYGKGGVAELRNQLNKDSITSGGVNFSLSNPNWANQCKAFPTFFYDYKLTDDEKECMHELASKSDFTIDQAWFFLDALNYRPNAKAEITAQDREVINLYYKEGNSEVVLDNLSQYLGLLKVYS